MDEKILTWESPRKHLSSAKNTEVVFRRKRNLNPCFLVTNSITQPLEPQLAADRFPIEILEHLGDLATYLLPTREFGACLEPLGKVGAYDQKKV